MKLVFAMTIPQPPKPHPKPVPPQEPVPSPDPPPTNPVLKYRSDGRCKPVTGDKEEVIVQHTTEIPREGWDKFFNRFSEDHDTQFVAVEVMGPDIGAQVEGRSLLLERNLIGDHRQRIACPHVRLVTAST